MKEGVDKGLGSADKRSESDGDVGRERSCEIGLALSAVKDAAALCKAAPADAAIEQVIRQLGAVASAVEAHWPLTPDVRASIDLGPFAAKSISDLNPALADALMELDYALRRDGQFLRGVSSETRTPLHEVMSVRDVSSRRT